MYLQHIIGKDTAVKVRKTMQAFSKLLEYIIIVW